MFESSDGLVNVAASSGKMWVAFCKALGAEDLLARPEYADGRSRARHKVELRADVAAVTKRFTTAELIDKLNAVGVPCGPVNDIGQAFEDEQVQYLRMTRTAHHNELGDVKLVRTPINLSAFPDVPDFHHAAPDPGQHTDEILRELGYDDARIAALRAEGAIA
jgi:crotonobetainyl-CoA:carnitine CoA-transferase CaiB-like acyl-CoA transferase